jgi:hypothetical protein
MGGGYFGDIPSLFSNFRVEGNLKRKEEEKATDHHHQPITANNDDERSLGTNHLPLFIISHYST